VKSSSGRNFIIMDYCQINWKVYVSISTDADHHMLPISGTLLILNKSSKWPVTLQIGWPEISTNGACLQESLTPPNGKIHDIVSWPQLDMVFNVLIIFIMSIWYRFLPITVLTKW